MKRKWLLLRYMAPRFPLSCVTIVAALYGAHQVSTRVIIGDVRATQTFFERFLFFNIYRLGDVFLLPISCRVLQHVFPRLCLDDMRCVITLSDAMAGRKNLVLA